ncbi:MAG: hypothetical protein HY074_07380 [Deltaproteobacteria bacterium]|nr:hypothetical protein [Deltaproteobacteria bacterium]
MRQWLSSSLVFSSKMMFSAALSLVALVFVLAIVARLDVAFFEANGMLQNEFIREAFYYQIFQVDAVIIWMLMLGFLAVLSISFLFCKSQFDYYRSLARAFKLFSDNWESPPTASLGRFNPYVTYFFDILSRRMNGETEEALEPLIARATREWPQNPQVSWYDQLQFATVAGMLGMFFSACCVIFYLKVSGRVVELANSIVHFTNTNGPSFLTEQFSIISILVWMILGITTLSFIVTGYRFGRQIAEADYAILRDMKDFMEGNFRQRLFLRSGDPAQEYVLPMNETLEAMGVKLRAPGATTQMRSTEAPAGAALAAGVAVKTG